MYTMLYVKYISIKLKKRGALVAQSAKRLSLDFGSGHDQGS